MNKDDIKIKLVFHLPFSIISLVIGTLIYMTDCHEDVFCELLRSVWWVIFISGVLSLFVSVALLLDYFYSYSTPKTIEQNRNALQNNDKVKIE